MKKSKILIPTLSIASVGAVVAPIATMTSCTSGAFMTTSDINYQGRVHEIVAAGDNAWTIDKATEEYYKDSKIVAEDAMTVFIPKYTNSWIKELLKHKNVKYSFNLTINSLKLGDAKDVTIEDAGQTITLKGHMISGDLTANFNASYDTTYDELEEKYSSQHIEDSTTMSISFDNCYTFIQYAEGYGWLSFITGMKNASDQWEIHQSQTEHRITTSTLNFDGSQVREETGKTQTYAYSAKFGNTDRSVFGSSYIPSNYLSKVAYKKA